MATHCNFAKVSKVLRCASIRIFQRPLKTNQVDDKDKQKLLANLVKNRRQVELAITHLNRFHLRSVRKGTKVNELELDNIFAKLLLPLWVSLLEVQLNIILYRHAKFEGLTIDRSFHRKSETEKWVILIETAFRESYGINPKKELSVTTLGDTAFHRYEKIVTTVKTDIEPYIQLRNRIAHGQWSVAFNEVGQGKNTELTQMAWTLSKRDLMLLKIFIKNLPKLVNDIALSKKAFEQDYDKYMGRINLVKIDIDNRFRVLLSKGIGPV